MKNIFRLQVSAIHMYYHQSTVMCVCKCVCTLVYLCVETTLFCVENWISKIALSVSTVYVDEYKVKYHSTHQLHLTALSFRLHFFTCLQGPEDFTQISC